MQKTAFDIFTRQIFQVLTSVFWKHFRSVPPFRCRKCSVPPSNHPSAPPPPPSPLVAAAGQGLQITKWPAVRLFPINLEICWVSSNETLLYLLRISKRFYIEKFHLIKPNRFLDLLEKLDW